MVTENNKNLEEEYRYRFRIFAVDPAPVIGLRIARMLD